MAKNHIQPGKILDLIAPSGGVVSGNVYKIGAIIAVALVTAAEGETFAGQTDECWTLPAATSQAWTQGALLYWDDSAKKFTTTSTSNTKAGVAIAAKGSADATGKVKLIAAI